MVDPWAGVNNGVAGLNDTFNNMHQQSRQTALDTTNAELARQQLAMGAIKLQETQRQQTDATDYRAKLAGITGPQTTTATTDAPNPLYNKPLDPGLSQAQADNEGEWTPSAIAVMRDAQGLSTEPAQETQPAMVSQTTTTTKTEAQQRMDLLTEHAQKTGDYDPVTKAINIEGILAKRKAEMESTGGDMSAYVKSQMDLNASKELITTVAPLMKTSAGRNLAEQYLSSYKATHPNNSLIQAAKLDDFSTSNDASVQRVYDPQTGQLLGHNILDPASGNMVFKQSNAAEVANTDFGTFKNGFKVEHPQATDADISRAWHVQKTEEQQAGRADARQTIINNPIPSSKSPTGGLSDLAITDAATMYNITGSLPSGRNKEANAAIQNKAAELRQASGQSAAGVVANAGDIKALQGTIVKQEAQVGSMGSFVKNIDKQVNRFSQISQELNTFDTRLLNVPLRELRGKVAGSPLQAKVDMYLTEISSETGKLASGATGSVAELSQGAREKWEKIHDPNLSMADLLDVLKETKHAGLMRMDSVNEQLAETRKKRGYIGKSSGTSASLTQYLKANLGKFSEDALIASIRHSNPGITNAEISAAYNAARGK